MEKLLKPKTIYMLVYECGRVDEHVFYTEKIALKVAESMNMFENKHMRVVKYTPEI